MKTKFSGITIDEVFKRHKDDPKKSILPVIIYCKDPRPYEDLIGTRIVLGWWDFCIISIVIVKKVVNYCKL